MDHSVRAYLERIPVDKLISLLESESFEDTYWINDSILHDLLEALISRNAEEGGLWSEYIYKIQEKQKQSVSF